MVQGKPRALITGITGQDGSYLSELLISEGYHVHGIIRRSSSFNTSRIDHLVERGRHSEHSDILTLHYGDLLDPVSIHKVLWSARPAEIYHLGAQSHVKTSFDQPVYTTDTISMGTAVLLESIREYRDAGHDVRFYLAGSSEMFGSSPPPQSEDTPFRPRSPYAAAKVHAYDLMRVYREAYDLWCCCGILFNHESPRRGETFVTRKITRAAGRIRHGLQEELRLGNLDATRDWGYASEYMRDVHRMMKLPDPVDLVIATGVEASVQDWLGVAFGWHQMDWRHYVHTDHRYFRPLEVEHLRGDQSRAESVFDGVHRTSYVGLCELMAEHDDRLARSEKAAAQVS